MSTNPGNNAHEQTGALLHRLHHRHRRLRVTRRAEPHPRRHRAPPRRHCREPAVRGASASASRCQRQPSALVCRSHQHHHPNFPGGTEGIRTPGPFGPSAFKADAFVHSATVPSARLSPSTDNAQRVMRLRRCDTQSSASRQRASACSRALCAAWPAAGNDPKNFTPPCLACSSRSASAINSSATWPSA